MSFYRGETVNGQRFCSCGCGGEAKRIITNGRFKSWRMYAVGHAPRERYEVTIPTDPIDLAYAAGIIDGEGCIFARASLRSDNTFSTMLQVQVAMCSASVIKWLRDHFGGRLYTDVPKSTRIQCKRRYVWQVCGKRVGELLPSLIPYLIEKRQRAELAVELAGRMSGAIKGKHNKLSDDEKTWRIQAAATIKMFNRNPYGEDIEEGAPIQ